MPSDRKPPLRPEPPRTVEYVRGAGPAPPRFPAWRFAACVVGAAALGLLAWWASQYP